MDPESKSSSRRPRLTGKPSSASDRASPRTPVASSDLGATTRSTFAAGEGSTAAGPSRSVWYRWN
nr:unnamed protein product [Digitaria exilis]